MKVRRIRIGNTFAFPWQITRAGAVEDLSRADSLKLTRYIGKLGRDPMDVPVELANNNTLTVVVTTAVANKLGDYIYELTYELRDASLPNGERECAVDIMPFRIVALTAEADPDEEFAVASDLLIGLVGPKFESKDFTPQEWAEIKRPSLEAAQQANDAIADIEVRSSAAIESATAAAQIADDKAFLANEAKNEAEIATEASIVATGKATTATQGANDAAAYAQAQGNRLAAYELITSKAVNNTDYNEITF